MKKPVKRSPAQPLQAATKVVRETEANDLQKVLTALHSQPARKQSALEKMVIDAAKAENFDYEHATAGAKAAFTRRVKEAMKQAGIPL